MSLATMAATHPDVTGTIVDDNGMPMGFANVVLLNPNDSTFIQGATSTVDGRFTIVTPETDGILKISSRWIAATTQSISILASTPTASTSSSATPSMPSRASTRVPVPARQQLKEWESNNS